MSESSITTPGYRCERCQAELRGQQVGEYCSNCLLNLALAPLNPCTEDFSGTPTSATGFPESGSFKDYELLEEIARGGMGIVYKARQLSLNRIVALKVVLPTGCASEGFNKRFQIEAEAAATLDHQNIVPVYAFSENGGWPFFTMKFIDGGTLSAAIRQKRFEHKRGVQLLIKVARAIHYAHTKGIIHRDLKPGNILLDKADEPFVSDFGLAKLLEKPSDITQSRTVLGTLCYMSPEQASGQMKDVSTASDIYALGAILYELLSGHPPFRADSNFDLFKQIIEHEVPPIRLSKPGVDPEIEAICLKCLEKSPAGRYDSGHSLAVDLQRYLDGEPVFARKTPTNFMQTNWADPVFSQNYREVADRIIPDRSYLFHIVMSYFRHFVMGRNHLKVCDLGCGDGVLAEQLLSCDSNISMTLIDGSEEMIGAARRRLGAFERVEFLHNPFSEIIDGKARVGSFHFVVSAFSIHHLPDHEKIALFRSIFQRLQPGGYFLNMDVAIPEERALKEWYAELWREWILAVEKLKSFQNSLSNSPEVAQSDPVNKYTTLTIQLKGLRAAGFEQVDCHYRNGIFVIYSGRKPLETES